MSGSDGDREQSVGSVSLQRLAQKGVTTVRERHLEQEPRCGFGELGLCCRHCFMGPCRIDPFGDGAQQGLCGATADTIVALRGALLGKPHDADEARAMLEFLRGRTHRVVTAVAVLPAGRRGPLVDHAVTRVTMRRYTDAEIAASIARGDPFDKAGAYAIQDDRIAPVARYDGCYCNVVGLPLWTAVRLLGRAGLDITNVRATKLLRQCGECSQTS